MANKQLTVSKLQLLSSNEVELKRFLLTDAGQEISEKITKAVTSYIEMMKELQYMEENLPGVLDDLKTIQQKVDKRHKRSNIATIGGCATSIAGGALVIGGIVAAPFTLGASIGLTATGTAVALAGGATTTTAKTADFLFGVSDSKKSNKMVAEFYDHYKAAKEAYETVHQICEDLSDMFPSIDQGNVGRVNAAIGMIASTVGFAIDSTRMPKLGFTAGVNALTIGKAVVSPAQLHAATKLALSPVRAVPLTRQFLVEAVTAVKCAAQLDASGFRVTVMTSFRTVGLVLKTAGALIAVGGIILDSYSLYSAGKELYKNEKCKVSQDISKHIQELQELGCSLKKLNEDLTASITCNSVAD